MIFLLNATFLTEPLSLDKILENWCKFNFTKKVLKFRLFALKQLWKDLPKYDYFVVCHFFIWDTFGALRSWRPEQNAGKSLQNQKSPNEKLEFWLFALSNSQIDCHNMIFMQLLYQGPPPRVLPKWFENKWK